MLGTCIAIIVTLIVLLATYVLSMRHIKPIIRDIAFNIWYFAKDHDKLTTEAIRNITWNDHDKLFWLVTLVWLMSMFCGAIFTVIMFMNFG
jgi:multisubunit Na+/H+ antiporter MnhB subunit